MIRPFPRAAQRNENRKGRKRGKSRIITDSPEKQSIEECKKKFSRLTMVIISKVKNTMTSRFDDLRALNTHAVDKLKFCKYSFLGN